MGITGLLPFLENASRKCYINEFRGSTVAIDSYCWLHKGAFACADKLVRGENTNVHIMYCLKYIQLLLDNNIKPIMVFDGQHLTAKKDTETKRREQRKTARSRGMELLRLGKAEEARQFFRQCVDITHDMALALIKECRKRNIDCIVAPYEADAQLAYLNFQGIAQIIITEDSDLVLFGCTKILFKFSLDGSATLVEQNKLYLAMKLPPDEFTFDKFRYMCIMSGCDYLDSLPGVGLKRAHKAVAMTHDPNIYNLLPRLPRYLNLRKLVVSQKYIENFKLADATLRHQVVFDPIKRQLVRLTDPETTGISPEYLKNAGQMFDNEQALQLALGNIDPISSKVKDDWNPDISLSDTNYFSSIWSKGYKKSKSLQKTSNHSNISVKSTKNQIVTVSTANILAAQEQQMLDYDNKLAEELKVYQTMQPPPKRQKINAEADDVAEQPEIIAEVVESEVKVETFNPFIKSKQSKRLSKFGQTTLKNEEFVASPFFISKSKPSEIDDNKKCETEVSISEQNSDGNSSSEGEVFTNACSTICSNEEDNELGIDELNNSVSDDIASGSISLKSFTFKKLEKKICNGISKLLSSINEEEIDSPRFNDVEKNESESSCLDNASSFSTNEDLVTPANSQDLSGSTELCSQKSNEVESNPEDDDGRTSPILSVFASPAVKTYSRNNQNSRLATFRFNKLDKRVYHSSPRKKNVDKSEDITLFEKATCNDSISSENVAYEDIKVEEENRESDIENLTPEEKSAEIVEQCSIETVLLHPEEYNTALLTCSSYNVESDTNVHEKNTCDTEVCVVDEFKFTTVQQKTKSIPLKGTIKRSNSCRSVGLSRNRKKAINQPTILSMFNKMTSKD